MTNAEAIGILTSALPKEGYVTHVYREGHIDEALRVVLKAAIEQPDPEWIPNTGTKPECEYAWVRFGDGTIVVGASEGWLWNERPLTSRRITHYIPIPDPPEFKEKRRYVVELMPMGDVKYSFIVEDTSPDADVKWLATHIETESAAQSIADIYEAMHKEKP